MNKRGLYRPAIAAGVFACILACSSASALTITIDYSYDYQGFFDSGVNPYANEARAALENAAASYEMFTDNLLEIREYGRNTWQPAFFNPATGIWTYGASMVVPADTMIVYAAGRQLGTQTLGIGGPGGYKYTAYDSEWPDLLNARGQTGALTTPKTDFGPWGGSVAFDIDNDWSYDLNSGPSDNQHDDFFSTCLHELAHVLGFGDATSSWGDQVSGGTFTGSAAGAVYGGPVPLASDDSHWVSGTLSQVGGQEQEAAMDPTLLSGTRKRLTDLDIAGLEDVGWEMPDYGDINRDGTVDAADYILLKQGLGQSDASTWSDGDLDFDGQVTLRDLAILGDNLAAGGANATIPEPASLALLAVGAVVGLARRRRGAAGGVA